MIPLDQMPKLLAGFLKFHALSRNV